MFNKKLAKPAVAFIFCLLLLFHSGCRPKARLRESLTELSRTVDTSKLKYLAAFSELKKKPESDSSPRLLEELNNQLLHTTSFMDSLAKVLGALDFALTEDVDSTHKIIFEKGVGDSLFNKLNKTISMAKNIGNKTLSSQAQKTDESILSSRSAESWKKEVFFSTNPLGIEMMLYGFEDEIYRMVIEAVP